MPGAESCMSCPQNAPYSAPRSTSLSACISVCPNTSWILWFDSNGTEGAHSCLLQVVAAVTWVTANSSCWAIGGGSHLLTSRQVRDRNRRSLFWYIAGLTICKLIDSTRVLFTGNQSNCVSSQLAWVRIRSCGPLEHMGRCYSDREGHCCRVELGGWHRRIQPQLW